MNSVPLYPVIGLYGTTRIMYHFNIVNWTFLLQFVSFMVRCCSKGVASNSLQCTSCHKWVHKKCNAIKGSMLKVMVIYL